MSALSPSSSSAACPAERASPTGPATDRRLHLQEGPIDLIIEAFADEPVEVVRAYEAAARRFTGILQALVDELPLLRSPLGVTPPPLKGPVARRMLEACWPHRAVFITPMAAVAGAVADEVLAAMVGRARLRRAYVNNGGDIAIHLAPSQRFTVGLAGIEDAALHGALDLGADDAMGGVATSGWRGRSLSLGIADAVTVVGRDAAAADAAATLVANAVNVDDPRVQRLPARAVRDDTDLGDLLVTVGVDALPEAAIAGALDSGLQVARHMQASGLIHAACLRLQGHVRIAAPLRDRSEHAVHVT
jgi:ApbE superfamily uncharacterized protein (UPF0280 family)